MKNTVKSAITTQLYSTSKTRERVNDPINPMRPTPITQPPTIFPIRSGVSNFDSYEVSRTASYQPSFLTRDTKTIINTPIPMKMRFKMPNNARKTRRWLGRSSSLLL
ncbi:unnamed protein product [Albugo candida]|uniref:Uncharacterized protein n=1 Tax=Albugo candida TaxID=65357 RepID=A0A024FZD5_9STRA|nr:unnamed protein product [Albugo candida]|eukprot:CCI39939.1 unnamed protein product [Albugo candida]